MPQVPGLTPQVAPSEGGVPSVGVPVPVDAFGGAVGHALQGLGTSIEGASDRIWQRAVDIQNMNNETSAKEADAKYMIESSKLHEEFAQLEGQAAHDAFPGYIQRLQDLRTSIRGGLPNAMAQRMYDASSLSFMGRTVFNIAGHAGQQAMVAANNASSARIDAAKQSNEANPDDDLNAARMKRVVETEVEAQGARSGWLPDQIEETKKAQVSDAIARRINGKVKKDVYGAQRMLDEAVAGHMILPTVADKIQDTVTAQMRQVGSRNIADIVLKARKAGEEPDLRSENEYVADGLAKMKELGLDKRDPQMADFVENRVRASYRSQKSSERDAQWTAEQTIIGAMNKGNNEGVLPTSPEELALIDPAAKDAWDRIGDKRQSVYMQRFAENAIGEPKAWTADSVKKFQFLKGLAHTNPIEFMGYDLSADAEMPHRGKVILNQMQKSLRKDLQTDPRVGRALGILQGAMNAAGVDKKNKDDYNQFVGQLSDQLDEFQAKNKRTPTIEEVQTIGKQLMDEHVSGMMDRIFGGYKTYQMPVPDDDAKRIRQDPGWAKIGVEPTDYWVARQYHREQFNKLYGAKKTTAPGGKPPVSE